jgi:hypothetical protein
MANTFLTSSIIAKEALLVLHNNLVAAGLVYRDYSEDFAKVGDIVTVRKPATFKAKEYGGESIDKQTAKETSVPVKLDKHMDVSFAVTSKEMSLDIEDFSKQLIQPAMAAHAQAIDAAICGLYKDIPYVSRSADSTAWSSLKAMTAARKVQNDNKVPNDNKAALLGTTADAALLNIDAVVNAEKSGSTAALRNASIGNLFGYATYMDQNVVDHTGGAGTVIINKTGGYAAGTTDMKVSGVTTALVVGDALTIGGKPYVVTEAGELSATAQDIAIYPALSDAADDKAPVTLVGAAEENLAFHRNAFALVTRPLAAPQGAAKVETLSWQGISIRVVYDYDMDLKSDVVSLDCLWGVQTLTRELAVRVHG